MADEEIKVTDAIEERLREVVIALMGGEFVLTRWMVIVEVSNGAGSLVQTANSDNLSLNDAAGLLRFATRTVDLGIDDLIGRMQSGGG